MNGFCGILSKDKAFLDKYAFVKSINLIDTMQTQTNTKENCFSVVSFLDSAPLKGPRIYDTPDYIFHFAGDLINYNEIPWDEIDENFSQSKYDWFCNLRGVFAFAIVNKNTNIVRLISDNRAQLPVYYGYVDKNFIFSTSISTFTVLESVSQFNIKWLYEYLYFNFPIDTTTCLENVNRMRARTIVDFNPDSDSIKEYSYGKNLKTGKKIKTGNEAYKIFIKNFKERVRKYYSDTKLNIVALSGGFDSRTLLSVAPKKANILTYTYGISGTSDLKVASSLTSKLNINHNEILFDENFKESLSKLIYKTVRLSGGVQSILRSTLPYVYKNLSEVNLKDDTVVIGGIGGDILRGASGEADSAISAGMDHYYRTGKTFIDKDYFKEIFIDSYTEFENHIQKTVNKINELYGDPFDPVSYMSYDIYEVNPKYFGGECAIASNFITLRCPYFDRDILDMAFKTEIGNLGLSPYHKKEKEISFKKFVFQTKVMNTNPNFKYTFINGMPILLFAIGNKLLFKICRLFIRGFMKIKGEKPGHSNLENWDNWFKKILHKEFDFLLHNKSLLIDYIDKDFIKSVRHSNDIHLIGKLVSAEILLNLIKNKWNIQIDENIDHTAINSSKSVI